MDRAPLLPIPPRIALRPLRVALLLVLPLAAAACGSEPPADDGAGDDPEAGASAAGMPAGTDVWLLRLEEADGRLTAVQPRNFTSRPGYDNQPHFTPGGELLFVQQEGERTDLWRWDPETDLKHRVTFTPDESEYSPTPVPGGDGAVSYIKVEPDSTQRLWRISADGQDASVLLPDLAPAGYHAWIDEGRVAVYVLGSPPTLRLVDVSTGEARTVAEEIGRSPQAVPGRAAVSFTRTDENDQIGVFIYDAATDATEQVAVLPEGAEYHTWTPDGILLTGSVGRIAAWVNGAWADVGSFPHLEQHFTRLAVSPDGAWLAAVAEPVDGGAG